MTWESTTPGHHQAEGQYSRIYVVTEDAGKFRVLTAPHLQGRTCTTLADAKSYCEWIEAKLKSG